MIVLTPVERTHTLRRLAATTLVAAALAILLAGCSDSNDSNGASTQGQIVDLLPQPEFDGQPFPNNPAPGPEIDPPDTVPNVGDNLARLYGNVSIQHQNTETLSFFTLDFALSPEAVITDDAGDRYAVYVGADGTGVTCTNIVLLGSDSFFCLTLFADGEEIYQFFELRQGSGLGVFVFCSAESSVDACSTALVENPTGAIVVTVTESRSDGPAPALALTGTDAGELIALRQFHEALPRARGDVTSLDTLGLTATAHGLRDVAARSALGAN